MERGSCTLTFMPDMVLSKDTLIPIGLVGTLIVAGTWVGKIETTLEAHQLQLNTTPHALERLQETNNQISRDLAQIREAVGRLEGILERKRK